jgi:hypothetical protein
MRRSRAWSKPASPKKEGEIASPLSEPIAGITGVQSQDRVAQELRSVALLRRRALERHAGDQAAHTAGIALLEAAYRRALELLLAVEAPHDPD